jgi:hypothetical protein
VQSPSVEPVLLGVPSSRGCESSAPVASDGWQVPTGRFMQFKLPARGALVFRTAGRGAFHQQFIFVRSAAARSPAAMLAEALLAIVATGLIGAGTFAADPITTLRASQTRAGNTYLACLILIAITKADRASLHRGGLRLPPSLCERNRKPNSPYGPCGRSGAPRRPQRMGSAPSRNPSTSRPVINGYRCAPPTSYELRAIRAARHPT